MLNNPLWTLAKIIFTLTLVVFFWATLICKGDTPVPVFDVDKVDTLTIQKRDIDLTKVHRDQLNEQLLGLLKHENEDVIVALRRSLQSASQATADAAKHAAELQAEKDSAVAAKDHLLKKLHLAKIIANVLLIGIAAVAFLKILPPLNLYVAGAILFFGSVGIWWYL